MKRPLHLLLLYDGVYPETLGGVEMRNFDLARALAARGHTVVLGSLSDGQTGSIDGLEILPVGRPHARYNPGGQRSTREALRMAWGCARVDLGRFDLIETANIPYIHLVPLAWRCRRHRKPLLVTWYEYWGGYWRDYLGPLKWRAYAAIEWCCAQLGDGAVAVSRLTWERVDARRRKRDLGLLSIGIDADTILGRAASAPAGPPLIYAGRLMQEKRVDLLLRALALLPESIPSVALRSKPLLTVIGDGPEEASLHALADELGISDVVRFLGRLPEVEDVWHHLGSARVALQPSEREGFGIFALEAMAVGLPVVYCPSPENAMTELVESDVHGLAVEPTPEAFAEAIVRLLTDDAQLERLSQAASRRGLEYAWPNIAEQFETLAYGLLDG